MINRCPIHCDALHHDFTYPLNEVGSTLDVQQVGTSGVDLVATTLTVGSDGLEASRTSDIEGAAQDLTRTIDPTTGRDFAKRVTEATLQTGSASLQAQYAYDEAGRIIRQWGNDSADGSGYLDDAATGNPTYTYHATSGLKTGDNLQLQSVGAAGAISSSYTYDTERKTDCREHQRQRERELLLTAPPATSSPPVPPASPTRAAEASWITRQAPTRATTSSMRPASGARCRLPTTARPTPTGRPSPTPEPAGCRSTPSTKMGTRASPALTPTTLKGNASSPLWPEGGLQHHHQLQLPGPQSHEPVRRSVRDTNRELEDHLPLRRVRETVRGCVPKAGVER